jgi:prolipoprotein diacylglyceryltransferase
VDSFFAFGPPFIANALIWVMAGVILGGNAGLSSHGYLIGFILAMWLFARNLFWDLSFLIWCYPIFYRAFP